LEHSGVQPTIDVYTITLEAEPSEVNRLYVFLSPEERDRADRFRFDRHRREFIVSRGCLREILARYLHIAPAAIGFVYNSFGKPQVEGSRLRFNLSHSGAWAMLAVSAEGIDVGIDIERIDAAFVQDEIPEQFFSPSEVAALRSLPAAEQTDAFFRCWTRKEAYIKARGLGLSLALDSFDVTLTPGRPAAFLHGAGNWSLQELAAPNGYAAATSAEGQAFSVSICPPERRSAERMRRAREEAAMLLRAA
jgi:4'-phosphopantetheinyl transferase